MHIEISYHYEMRNSYQLNQLGDGEWEITVADKALMVHKKFETLCLYEFLEMHLERRTPDPNKALAFVRRWGPLNSDPINRVSFTVCEMVLQRMLLWSEKLSTKELQSLFESGALSKHFDQKLQINVAGSGKDKRPVLRPADLETAILLTGLIRGRQDYVRCHLNELLGAPRDENCPIGCWTRKDGRPGPDERVWGEERCRSYFNRHKIRRKWE